MLSSHELQRCKIYYFLFTFKGAAIISDKKKLKFIVNNIIELVYGVVFNVKKYRFSSYKIDFLSAMR